MIDSLLDLLGSLLDWILDRPLVLVGGGIALIVALCIWASSIDDKRCDELMRYTRTSRDTLDAKIACEAIRDNTSTGIAIGVGAGIVAGSRK